MSQPPIDAGRAFHRPSFTGGAAAGAPAGAARADGAGASRPRAATPPQAGSPASQRTLDVFTFGLSRPASASAAAAAKPPQPAGRRPPPARQSFEPDAAPAATRRYKLLRLFAGKDKVDSGGATGSKQVRTDEGTFQLKDHISRSSLRQRLATLGSNVQNVGEVIGASVARAVIHRVDAAATAASPGRDGMAGPQLVPRVFVLHDDEAFLTGAASEYLPQAAGDFDHYYAMAHGPLPADRKHVRLDFSPPRAEADPVPPGTLRMQGQAARDVLRHVGMAALLGDHDINTGNLVMLRPRDGKGEGVGQRVGRIDFGHAFNDLIAGTGSGIFGGGGVRDRSGSRILDFFNRGQVRGNPLDERSGLSKLWRDYAGAVPSHDLAAALAEVAGCEADAVREGLQAARDQFVALVTDLQAVVRRGGPDGERARAQLRDILGSLRTIAGNTGLPVPAGGEPVAVVDAVMGSLGRFVAQGQQELRYVAQLCELQAGIDDMLRKPPGKVTSDERLAIERSFEALMALAPRQPGAPKGALTWLRTSAGHPAVTGTLQQYIDDRRAILTEEATRAASAKPRLAFESRMHRLQAGVDAYARDHPTLSATPEGRVELSRRHEELAVAYKALHARADPARRAGAGLKWIQLRGEERAFQGDLDAYIRHRRELLAPPVERAPASRLAAARALIIPAR